MSETKEVYLVAPAPVKHLQDSDLIVHGFKLTGTGLLANDAPTYEDWYSCGEWLKHAEKAVGFWIGDWIRYGEQAKWGDTYTQAMGEFGLDYSTLRKYKYVSTQIPNAIRQADLGFTHHEAVAALDTSEQKELLSEAVTQEWTVDDLKKEIKQRKRKRQLADLPEPPTYVGEFELDSIQVAAIQSLELPKQSIDLIFTDPPYHDEYLDLYGALAELASHVLKPGAYLMAYCGKMYLPTIINTMEANGLEYIWVDAVFQAFSKSKISKHNLFENWRPIVVFKQPGDSKVREWVQDVVRGTRDKEFHEWQQDEDAPRQYIPAYTFPGDVVLDPFVGGGTTVAVCQELGRHFIGFDKDPDAVKMSIARLHAKHS